MRLIKVLRFFGIAKNTYNGCTYTLVDNRARHLNMRYCLISNSYLLYPVRYYSYLEEFQKKSDSTNFEKNLLLQIRVHCSSQVSPTLLLSLETPKNLIYFYHFGDKTSLKHYLDGTFTTCAGLLSIMIGVAKHMGFSKCIILWCDYLDSPKFGGHFYSDSK